MLKGFSVKFDGKTKTIFGPALPVLSQKKGLSSLEAIKYYAQNYAKFQINRFLVTIDAEHLQTSDVAAELRDASQEWGLGIQEIIELNDGSFKLRICIGGRQFITYVVIFGKRSPWESLEDHIALLIKLETGIDISCQKVEAKKKIRETLSRVGNDIEELVINSTLANIKQAFPPLAFVFEELEQCY